MDRHLPVFLLNKIYYDIYNKSRVHTTYLKNRITVILPIPTKNLVAAAVEFVCLLFVCQAPFFTFCAER
jgi:hypothetical protein